MSKITEVAAIIEDSDKFIQPGEARTTQFATRTGLLSNEYLTGKLPVQPLVQTPMNKTPQLDYEGDTEMQGMRLELQNLTAMINKISVDGNGAKRKSQERKPAAPWRTEAEVAMLRDKRVCLRCLKPGHFARYCEKFGPAIRPDQNQMDSILDLASFVQENQGAEAGEE